MVETWNINLYPFHNIVLLFDKIYDVGSEM